MVKTRSMTRNQNHDDDASGQNRIKTCENSGAAPWLELNHDVLYLVMMQLGVVDFVGFGGVCKSWRSLALSNRERFMASRPPMSLCISTDANKTECYLADYEGRKFKTILPPFCSPFCRVGFSCGYLILFGWKTHNFWLVNPITRHELRFPNFPINYHRVIGSLSAILVFSPSKSGWLFVVLHRHSYKVWFCIEGKGAWNHVSSTSAITDLHFFKGKIYTLTRYQHLYELRLNPEPKLTLLEINNSLKHHLGYTFISSGEHLYVMQYFSKDRCNVNQLDFGEMKWVSHENREEDEYACFYSYFNHGVVVKPESLADSWSGRYVDFVKRSGKGRLIYGKMWYFPNQCLNVDLLDECLEPLLVHLHVECIYKHLLDKFIALIE